SAVMVEMVPKIGSSNTSSTSFGVFTVVSKYSNKNANPTPNMAPNTRPIAMFNLGFGFTGDGFSDISATDYILTLSTLINSVISSLNTSVVSLAMVTATFGLLSCTLMSITCDSSTLSTDIFEFN